MPMPSPANVYVNGAACIAPEGTLPENGPWMRSVEPGYDALIDPRLIRRMSKVVRTGAAAAVAALRAAGVEQPGAIITGTAFGCVDDTEQFLTRLIRQSEDMLAPTAFIQSTHNTIGAQIALLLRCHAYNNTIVQRAVSFEHALQDAMLLIESGEAQTALAGAADELPDNLARILGRFDAVRSQGSARAGRSVAGEGAAYFLLGSEKSAGCRARLMGVETFYRPEKPSKDLLAFLNACDVDARAVSLVLSGMNGDDRFDPDYAQVLREALPGAPVAGFKHRCGEYPVASSYAAWAAAELLSGRNVLDEAVPAQDGPGKHILIYNRYFDLYHAFILIGSC